MFNTRMLSCFGSALVALTLFAGVGVDARTYRIGFFEGGPYQSHADFRNHFRNQLQAMAPSGVEILFPADAFHSAEWHRDRSRELARGIAAARHVDMVVATGPWSVEDLLAAGFDRPIIAACRFDPLAEGLIDERGRPIVDHLTVRVRPQKAESDLYHLAGLTRPDTVGVLYFPSGDETARALDSMRTVGRRLGFEIITSEAYDTDGCYAYFKAYRQLSRSADAVYLLPLWGCDGDKIRSFYQMLERDGKPAFASEGAYHVARGALASLSGESPMIESHFQAWKAVRIIQGTVPADLPVALADSPDLTINDQVARTTRVALPLSRVYDLAVVEGPSADSVERLTVVDAVAAALAQNPGLQAVTQTLAAAERAASEARSAYLPQLELHGSAAYQDDNAVNNDPRYDNTRLGAHLTLRQELFALGAIGDMRTASLSRDRQGLESKQAALDLELAVNLAYLDLVEIEQLRLIIQGYRQQAGECFQIAQLRLSLAEVPAVDVWRAEQEWLASLQAVREIEGRRRVARVLLNTLLGRPADFPFVIDWRHFSSARFANEESLLEQLTQSATQRTRIQKVLDSLARVGSPEAQSSELDLRLDKSRLSRTNADFWPAIGFFADLGVTDELAAREGFDEANPTWTIGAEIRVPLFQGGRRLHERRRMSLLVDRGLYLKDQTTLRVAAEVRVALENTLSRAGEAAPAVRAAELAAQTYPEVFARYAHGAERVVDLLDAVRSVRSAGANAITTQTAYYRAAADLVRRAGLSPHGSSRSASEELLRVLTTQPAARP